MHVIAFVFIVVSSLSAPIAVAAALRGQARWRGLPAVSLVVAVLEFVFLFALGVLGHVATVVWMALLFGWLAALGAWLRRLADAGVRRA